MVNPIELPKEIIIPKVVDETGKEVSHRTDVLQMVIQLAQLGQLARIRKSLEKAEFEGVVDPRTLSVTDRLQQLELLYDWPFTPWISAYFINHGLNTARIAINYRGDEFELMPNETITIDHAHADERIRRIYYICNPGETTSVTVKGHY